MWLCSYIFIYIYTNNYQIMDTYIYINIHVYICPRNWPDKRLENRTLQYSYYSITQSCRTLKYSINANKEKNKYIYKCDAYIYINIDSYIYNWPDKWLESRTLTLPSAEPTMRRSLDKLKQITYIYIYIYLYMYLYNVHRPIHIKNKYIYIKVYTYVYLHNDMFISIYLYRMQVDRGFLRESLPS
jgi:hypothetical protein